MDKPWEECVWISQISQNFLNDPNLGMGCQNIFNYLKHSFPNLQEILLGLCIFLTVLHFLKSDIPTHAFSSILFKLVNLTFLNWFNLCWFSFCHVFIALRVETFNDLARQDLEEWMKHRSQECLFSQPCAIISAF